MKFSTGLPTSNANINSMYAIIRLKRWARNPTFLSADLTICLIAENQIELNQGIVQNPGVSCIEIPLPDGDDRLEYAFSGVEEIAAPVRITSEFRPSADMLETSAAGAMVSAKSRIKAIFFLS